MMNPISPEFNSLAIIALMFSVIVAGCDKQAGPGVSSDSLSMESSLVTVKGKEFEVFHLPGYQLEPVNLDLDGPRILHFSGDRLFIGSKSEKVYWLDPPYDQANVLAKLDYYPHSVVVRDGFIYVARAIGVFRAPYSADTTSVEPDQFKRYFRLPGAGGHASRTLKQGPDGNLYVSIGISGNCPDEYLDEKWSENTRRGGIYRVDESDTGPVLVPYATGLRNPVGFDWEPGTNTMYASNNGPDHLGFEQPPEYFARLDPGSFHGMPWFQYDGEKVLRDECIRSDPPRPLEEVSIPAALFPARNAPMDVAFVPPDAEAKDLHGDAIVALRGSWGTTNKGKATGNPASRRHPALVTVNFDNHEAVNVTTLLTGFQLEDGKRWARPVGVAIGPDGQIYFTSDSGLEGLYRLRKL